MRRIPSLDGLRAISIAMVLVGHLALAGKAPVFLVPYATMGVRIFFVISGYLITAILLKERERTSNIDLRQFYIRRAYRIFPAALVFMMIVFAVYWRSLRWYDMAISFFYVVNWFPRPQVIGHLWSLSAEEQFYLLWPTVLKKWHRHRVAILIGTVVLSPVYSAVLVKWFHNTNWFHGAGLGTLPAIASTLATGCLLAIYGDRWPKVSKSVFFLCVLWLIAVPRFNATSSALTLLLLFVVGPLRDAAIAGILIHVVRNPYRILNIAPVVWLGQISYSLYLWQQPFVDPASPTRYGVLAALGAAVSSYYLIERPCLRKRDGKATVPTSRQEQVAA